MGFINKAKESKELKNKNDTSSENKIITPVQQISPAEEKKEIKTPKDNVVNTDENGVKEKKKGNISEEEFEGNLRTVYDDLITLLLQNNSKMTFGKIVKSLSLKRSIVEKLVANLEKEGLLETDYSLNFLHDGIVKYNPQIMKKKVLKLPKQKEMIETYEIIIDSVKGIIKIWTSDVEDVPLYELIIPEPALGTRAIIEHLIENMSQKSDLSAALTKDHKKLEKEKEIFIEDVRKEIIKVIPNIDEEKRNTIAGMIYHKMYGLGELEILMGDNWLEEVAINSSMVPISVFHKRFGWTKTTVFLKSEEEIYNFASQVGRKVGRQINTLNPLMDAHLITGDRVAATISPISTAGNTITIRRFSRNPWTIVHLIDPKIKTMSVEIAAFLWLCIQYELNIMVAGGTASGKTSVLNSVCSLIPATQRILSIEDTREISLPEALQWNWVPLSSRKPNPEGEGGISMLDLMVESLRMRPDRIIVGEIRRKEQAETLFETMHTGHSVYATMHADTVEQVERRLLEPPIEIPKTEIGALQLVIVQYRDRRKGSRRTLEVAEILSDEKDDNSLSLNYLYRWKPRTDEFEKVNDSIRVMEDLNLHTGMTAIDIENELREKESILSWMSKHDVKDVDIVGTLMKMYYKSKEVIIKAASNDLDPFEVVRTED